MRQLLVCALILSVGCGGPTGSVPPKASPTSSATSTPFPGPSSVASPYQLPSPTPLPPPVVGGVVEYEVVGPDVNLGDMTAGPDGSLWFVDNGVPPRVGRIAPSGAVSYIGLAANIGTLRSITNGPDGNLWMTAGSGLDGVGSWILRISTNGVVTKFPVSDTSPTGITAGPDGNMWFTEFFSGVIVRMTTDGVVLNEFPAPRGGLDSIVMGPDRNLWFTETVPALQAIGRMTPSGVVTEFELSRGIEKQVGPRAIAVGPDHNIWFVESTVGKIGRITPAGAITLFPLPGGGSAARLATGPDGNLWFTGNGGSNAGVMGRITPGGTIRLFLLPQSGADPIGIAAGADGRIWFTEWNVNRIGSIGERVPEVRLGSRLLTFGTDHTAATRTMTITSTGDAGVSISSVKVVGSNPAAFTVARDTCSGRTVASGATCQVDVTVAPAAGQGVLSGWLTLTDNATGSPHVVSLVAQLPACRLPVYTLSDAPIGVRGGFLNMRTGLVEPDASGVFDYDRAQGVYRSKTAPGLVNTFPEAYYDSVARRWLPASSVSMSPDRTRYAYIAGVNATINTVLHVVDATTGVDRALKLPSGPWRVLAFTNDGIYVHRSYEAVMPGLTLVNPDTGAVRTVFADDSVQLVGDGAAWVGSRNVKDPLPQPGGIGNGFNQLIRRDLVTGQKTVWLYASGAYVYVGAVGGGKVLVTAAFKRDSRAWILSGANQAERLTVPGTGLDLSFNGGFLADPQGIWLHGGDGIYLWRAGSGLTLVSASAATPAGACA
jgi:streptogramin lyase